MPCFRSPFPFLRLSTTISIIIHLTASNNFSLSLSLLKGQHGFSKTSYSSSRGVGKDSKVPTFTDAKEGVRAGERE